MCSRRRRLNVAKAGLVGMIGMLASVATAQEFPSRPVSFVVGSPAGSGFDVTARFFAEKLRPTVKQTILVENKPGAQYNIAAEYVIRAKPDGHSILIAPDILLANMHLFKNPTVNVQRDLVVAATWGRLPFMLVVDAKQPWKNLAELTAYLKTAKNKANYGATTPSAIVMAEIYKQQAGVEAVQVDYRQSADIINDLLGGSLTFAPLDPGTSIAQHRAGRLRILGISTGDRLKHAPDLPTMNEQGVPMDITFWYGMFVPVGTPMPIVRQINKWSEEVLAQADTVAYLSKIGSDPLVNTPEQAQALVKKTLDNWGDWVRLAKLPQL